MSHSTLPISRVNTAGPSGPAGGKLRRIRERLNLTLRAVEEATAEISGVEHNSEYFVSAGRLNQIENDGSLPSIFKLYSLATVYHLAFDEAAALYGIDMGKMEQHRARMPLSHTHLISADLGDPNRPVLFPIRFDNGFRPEKTMFLSRLIEAWGEIPAGLLSRLDLKRYLYGYIGLEDRMMAPLLRPGAIVQVDPARKRVANPGWVAENDRPIYFLELRYSYECCWCFQEGHALTLVPHPLSSCGPRTIRVPDEGEVLGQVTGIAMRLVQ
jgi:transcriptional regulator with XRE-family HTH domain